MENTSMKRLIFDEDHEMFRDGVRRFMLSEIEPQVEQWRENGCCDPAAFVKAGEQGLLCMWADEKYGGLGIKDFRLSRLSSKKPSATVISACSCHYTAAWSGPISGTLEAKNSKRAC